MPPPEEDGPDGSSIKPVSSLRARFETLSKPSTDTPPSSSPAPPSGPRQPSPGPRPEQPRIRRPPSPLPERTSSVGTSAPPPIKPKPRTAAQAAASATAAAPPSALPAAATTAAAAAAPSSSSSLSVTTSAGTPTRSGQPPLSPRPTRPTPSLLVEPPHSPPKGRTRNLAPSAADPSGFFLNPDSVAKLPAPSPAPKPASPSPSSSPRPPRIPSRPHTPTPIPSLDARRSPRLPPSQPPSPPPPRRRSAELRRERDRASPERSKTTTEKSRPLDKPRPKIPSQHFSTLPSPPSLASRDKRSPFSSPPSSSGSLEADDEPVPPMLPARPRPMSYQPPTQQHLTEHRDRDDILIGRHKTINDAPSLRPPLPTRPSVNTTLHPSSARPAAGPKQIPALITSQFAPPPRPTQPPRPAAAGRPIAESNGHVPTPTAPGPGHIAAGVNSMPPPPSPVVKRVVSTPVSSTTPTASSLHQNSMQFPPPPSRSQHGRSMTVDRALSRPHIASHHPASSTSFHPPSSSASNSIAAAAAASPAVEAPPSAFAARHATDMPAAIPAVIPAAIPAAIPASSSAHQAAPPSVTPVSMPFPDTTNINRRPPYAKHATPEISTKYDSRQMDVCGQRVATTGNLTRVWSLVDGEMLMSLMHGDNIKATCVAFKPAAHPDSEGTRVWIGTTAGELMEADVDTQSIVYQRAAAHGRHEVVRILRHYDELWTFDDGGSLYVWGPAQDTMGGLAEAGVPTLVNTQHQSYRLPRGHTFSIVVGDELWYATGKELRVFLPTMDGKAQFQVLMRALVQEGTGEISAGTQLFADPDKVYFGHSDGKVSIYSRSDYSCVGVVGLGSYKVSTLTSVGSYIWAGYNTGRVCVYDTTATPWVVKKEWQAHDNPVCRILADRSSAYHSDQPAQVVSLGADNLVRVWDGLLQDDWLESAMQRQQHTKTAYCRFSTITAHVMTWNAGASTPNSLRYADDDAAFMQNMLRDSGSPDIFIFGFQELVDLEDKTATAKRFLKSKKKNTDGGPDQDRMSHQYRDWRDFLVRCLDDYMDGELYHLLQTSHMVGLFTCIFVKSDLRARVRNVATTEVKRGMGGLHGNKGAIVIRFLVDNTSLCFVNCHLAAGQSQAASRHNDIAGILDASGLPAERDANTRIDTYTGGGDGSMILDHELCILNGDLNYRIDTMSRDAVVGAVKAGNLAKLLDRDQLLVARRRNAGFRLRAFDELPIWFAPTYKYDVGTDNYDSSEKKRSPAWCDRLLFRAGGDGPDSMTKSSGGPPRIQQLDYARHEVRVSDHRPVTGRFQLAVKQVDAKKRALAWMECQQGFEDHRDKVAREESLYYLTQVLGYDTKASQDLLAERAQQRAQRVRRSPSRHA